MEQGTKLKQTIQFGKKIITSPNQQSPPQQMYSTKKTEPPKGYTFYQSTRNPNNIRSSLQNSEKKADYYVSQQLDQNKRKTLEGYPSIKFNTESRQDKKLNPDTETTFKKNADVPQVSCFRTELQSSKGDQMQTYNIALASQKSLNQSRYVSTQLIQSKIITCSSDVEDQNKRLTISASDLDRRLQIENIRKYEHIEEEYYSLREKFTIIEQSNRILEKRNLDLVEEMLRSENTIKQYEEKLGQFENTTKKNQDSLKITRNIITSLNQRISRLQKQNESLTKSAEENCQAKLEALQASKNEALKQSEALVFELKLKMIDQNHELEHAIERQKKKLEEQYKQKDEKNMILEEQVTKLKEILGNMQLDLMNIDQENIRLDLQNKSFRQINSQLAKLEPEILRLQKENKDLYFELTSANEINKESLKTIQKNQQSILTSQGKISDFEAAIDIYKKEKQFQKSQIQNLKKQLQKIEEIYSPKKQSEQIQELREKLTSSKAEIKQLYSTLDQYIKDKETYNLEVSNVRQQLLKHQEIIEKLKLKCKERKQIIQSLEDQIEEKDGKVAQFNKNLMKNQLQILDLKEQLKKLKQHHKQEMLTLLNNHEKYQSDILRLEKQLVEHQQIIKSQQQQAKLLSQKNFELEEERKKVIKEVIPQERKDLSDYQEKEEQQSSRLLKLEQVIERIEILSREVDEKDEQIQILQEIILKRESQIEQLNSKIQQLQQQKLKSKSEREITNQYLNQQFTTNLELKEKLKIKQVEKQLQQSELIIVKNQIIEMEKQMKLIQHYKFEFDSRENIIVDLENKVKQAEKNEQETKHELFTLKQLLKNQQQQYLITLDEEIKKICMIEQEDTGEIKRFSPPKVEEPCQSSDEEDNQAENYPDQAPQMKQTVYQYDETLQDWMQKIEDHSREELISKIQQLNFVNKSLKMKMSDINQMEQNSNQIIMNKIKVFEEIIQKYQQDINQLQEINQALTQEKNELIEKCKFNEGKIQWMDNIYKQVQANLLQTNEELVKVQFQYINLKMEIEGKAQSNFTQLQDQKNEISENQKSQNNIPSEKYEENKFEEKEKTILELKRLSQQIEASIIKSDKQKSEQNKSSLSGKQLQKEDALEIEIIMPEKKMKDEEDREIEKFMEGQYEVLESEVMGVTYSIVVSQIDSQDEEEMEKLPEKQIVQESPQKQKMEINDDIQKMIEQYPDELFEQQLQGDQEEKKDKKQQDKDQESGHEKIQDNLEERDKKEQISSQKEEEKNVQESARNLLQIEQIQEENVEQNKEKQIQYTTVDKKFELDETKQLLPQIEKVKKQQLIEFEDEQNKISKDQKEKTL